MQKKYKITKKKFLDYLLNDVDDMEYWGNRWIQEMKQYGEISITVEELFAERGQLPFYLFEDDYPELVGDIDVEDIELVHTDWKEEYDRCKEQPMYFFENYVEINGERPSPEIIEKLRKYYETKVLKN
jgi:hypothetical protein